MQKLNNSIFITFIEENLCINYIDSKTISTMVINKGEENNNEINKFRGFNINKKKCFA